MGSPLTATGDSAADDVTHQDKREAHGEPLVEDLNQVLADELHAPVQHAAQPTLGKTPEYHPPEDHGLPTSTEEEDFAAPPPDFTRRGIHIPTRTSSNAAALKRRFFRLSTSTPPPEPMPGTSESGSQPEKSIQSSGESVRSYDTQASSITMQHLGPLQTRGVPEDIDRLSPLVEDDPQSYELTIPTEATAGKAFDLEKRSEQLFSREHLEAIFQDTTSLLRFTSFLSVSRPQSLPVLIYYLDALKAMRAIHYANAVAEALEPIEGHEFTETPPRSTVNAALEDKARKAFDILVRDELPAFITHVYIQLVSVSVQKRITGDLPPLLREASEGLAEVFCVSDPSRADNPIIFASEEFHRTTQYGVSYAIGRNCRFLQGPLTNRDSVARLRKALSEAKEVSEVFLNYRRDGSPFMNLLMMAPLLDSSGHLRYFIGAQVDVSGLVKDCTGLEAFRRYIDIKEGHEPTNEPKDEFQELSEMFNNSELDTVRRHGGNMHKEHLEEDVGSDGRAAQRHRPRLLINDSSGFETVDQPLKSGGGRLTSVYKHYLLIRPAPSLRILFVSPSLRVPGIMQSRFLDRIGGNTRVRNSVAEALTDSSRGVTAKIRWLTTATANLEDSTEEGRSRWIHCTPLLGASGAVGVWMVVLVDDEKQPGPARRFKSAPPIATDVRPQQDHKVSSEHSRMDSDGETEARNYERTVTPAQSNNLLRRIVEATRRSGSRSGSVMSDQPANASLNSFAL